MRALAKLQAATALLKKAGDGDAERDAELIISFCLHMDRTAVYRDNPSMSEDVSAEIDALIQRKSRREPLQYILGYVDFFGLKLNVGPGVLVPRPETELLAEEAISRLRQKRSTNPSPAERGCILDICTGSGCLALALAKAFPDTEVYATDISRKAIDYAELNAAANEVRNITFLQGSLFGPVNELFTKRQLNCSADLIVANPPYIRRDEIGLLQPEIREWEPISALDGGEDGLDYYRAIVADAGNCMAADGIILLELGIRQAEAVTRMAEEAGFRDISVKKDYAGIERILIAGA